MTKIRKIYYPILAVLFIAAIVLGFVSAKVALGPKEDRTYLNSVRVHGEVMARVHNSYQSDAQSDVRDYLQQKLKDAGVAEVDGTRSSDYSDATLGDAPCYLVQEAELNADAVADMSDDETLNIVLDTVYNVIVAVPGSGEGVTLFTANYDSAANSESGTECIQAAAMLQTVIDTVTDFQNGSKPQNTLLFVFTDAEHLGALGAYAFKDRFKGFDGIAEKVTTAVNFGANGTDVLAVEADKLSVSEVRGFASGLNSALDAEFVGTSDYDVYDVQKINVFFTGNTEYLNTPRDRIESVSDSKIMALGKVMSDLVSAYGGKPVTANGNGSFSYLGLTFSYGSVEAYVLGAIALVLLAVAIFLMIRLGRKTEGIVKGVLVQLASLAATLAVLYVCFFIIMLLLSGFGVVPINALLTVRYMNVGLFIGCLLLAFAAYAGVFLLIRRYTKVKATDAARGGAMLIMLLGIILSFAMPEASFLFGFTAVLEGVALILTAALGNKFKGKYSADIERLFAYTLPLILLTPAAIPSMFFACSSLGAVYLPIIMLAAVLGFSVIAPYFGLLKRPLGAVAARLPKHTIRVEREVTEQVEGAKKGRFETRTVKKVTNEKVEWTYHNRYGVAILAVVSALVIILFAVCPAHNFNTNKVDVFSYREAAKDNSVVYVWQQRGTSDSNGSVEEKLRVYDQVAYGRFATVDNGFSWNKSANAYERDFLGNTSSLLGTSTPISISVTGAEKNQLEFDSFEAGAYSYIDILFTNVSNVTEIVVVSSRYIETTYTNDGKSSIHLWLPYNDADYGNLTVRFSFNGNLSVGVEFNQYVYGTDITNRRMSQSIQEYADIVEGLSGSSVADDITCGMIFSRTATFKLGND